MVVVLGLTSLSARGIFPDQGLNLCFLHFSWILYHWATREVPFPSFYASTFFPLYLCRDRFLSCLIFTYFQETRLKPAFPFYNPKDTLTIWHSLSPKNNLGEPNTADLNKRSRETIFQTNAHQLSPTKEQTLWSGGLPGVPPLSLAWWAGRIRYVAFNLDGESCHRNNAEPLASPVGKESTRNAGDLGSIPGLGNPLEEGMATHSSMLAWRIPWTEEPGGGGKGYSPWGRKGSDRTEQLSLSCKLGPAWIWSSVCESGPRRMACFGPATLTCKLAQFSHRTQAHWCKLQRQCQPESERVLFPLFPLEPGLLGSWVSGPLRHAKMLPAMHNCFMESMVWRSYENALI